MTFDEVSMERSMSFMKALQELKNLRPQLYSAAEYCEKSYLHNEQKQMVLDNLKDYAVRALVNAVDHLGTVAYKLTDLFEQQTSDVSTIELKISCLNQQLLTCQTYTDKEGLKQQQLLAIFPRHHKHYVLPGPINRKLQNGTQKQGEAGQKHIQVKPHPFAPGTPAAKTLSWHLASETKSAGTQFRASTTISGGFHLLDAEMSGSSTPLATHLQSTGGGPNYSAVPHATGAGRRDSAEALKSLAPFRSFDAPGRREIIRAPVRSKSVLSGLFAKHKSAKRKMSHGASMK